MLKESIIKKQSEKKLTLTNDDKHYVLGTQLGRIQGDGIYNTANSMIINSRRIFSHHLQPQNEKKLETDPVSYYLGNTKTNTNANGYLNTSQSIGLVKKTFPVVSFNSITSNRFLPYTHSNNNPTPKTNTIEKLFYDNNNNNAMLNKDVVYNNYDFKKDHFNYRRIYNVPLPKFDIHNQLSSSQPLMTLSPGFIFKPPLNKESNQFNQSTSNESNYISVTKKMPNRSEYTIMNPWCVSQYTYKQYHNQKYHIEIEEYGIDIDRFNDKPSQGLFCLFKGYGGNQVAEYASKHFPDLFRRNMILNPHNVFAYIKEKPKTIEKKKKEKGIQTSIETLLINSFQKLDDEIKYMNCLSVGSTTCVVLLTKEKETLSGFNQENRMIYCANIGNSQCIIVDHIKAKRLSILHSVDNPSEKKRINQIGGIIYKDKVYGQFSITRAFGLFSYKLYGITSVPDVVKYCISARDRYLIIATNGVFDVLNDAEILFFCNANDSTEGIADNIIKNSILRNSKENISVYVIKL